MNAADRNTEEAWGICATCGEGHYADSQCPVAIGEREDGDGFAPAHDGEFCSCSECRIDSIFYDAAASGRSAAAGE